MTAKSSRAPRARVSAHTEFRQTKWESLTWDDVANWAGSRSVTRGRAYQRAGRVRDLGLSAEGKLPATVAGGHRYATGVWWEANALRSRCTCPVGWNGCRHAVCAALLGSAKHAPAARPGKTKSRSPIASPMWCPNIPT